MRTPYEQPLIDPRPLEPPDEDCEPPSDDFVEFWEDDEDMFRAMRGGCADG
jgi:hypothetical protein